MRNKREQHARKPPIPREFGRLVPARQEEHGEVVDICAGGAGADEAADALQRGIGIVAPQNIGGVKSGGAERGKAVLIDEAACGIGRAIYWKVLLCAGQGPTSSDLETLCRVSTWEMHPFCRLRRRLPRRGEILAA